jgi:hypothetical protein
LANALTALIALPALETTGTYFRKPSLSLLPKCDFGWLERGRQFGFVVDSVRHDPLVRCPSRGFARVALAQGNICLFSFVLSGNIQIDS